MSLERAPIVVDPELGRQKLCPGCDEWWPLDDEFWYRYVPRRRSPYWSARCRACLLETSAAKYRASRGDQPLRERHGRRNTPEYIREAHRRYYASLTPAERVARNEARNIRRRAARLAARSLFLAQSNDADATNAGRLATEAA